MVTLALTTSAWSMVACSDGYEGESAEAGYVDETRQDLSKSCGSGKYDGPQGADVSKWQGSFNWTTAGVTWGYARISDGTTYIDSTFDTNWSKMKSAGILRGAYQFFRPGQNATTQANMMVDKVGKLGAGDLPAMIDVEATDGQSAATIASKVKTWLDIVEKGTGKRPVIYTGPYFWQDNVKSTAFGDYPLWIAHYGATCPSIPDGWSKWTIWQYCDGQTQYCTNGKGFDRDVFNGSDADLKAFAGKSAGPTYGASYVDQSFPLATTALVMKAGETIEASITLKNSGNVAWDSSTRLGTTEPRDRESPFADSSWLSANRPASVTGSVAPGESFEFKFTFHAPAEPGTYHEHFGVVQEGVAWFSDSGQAGPPDDQLEALIEVQASDVVGGAGGAGGEPATGGDAGAAGSDVGLGGSTGLEDAPTTDQLDGGCACRIQERAPARKGTGLLLLLGLAALRRRRR
jgi:lysozyme